MVKMQFKSLFLAALAGLSSIVPEVLAASLTEVKNFGSNPTGVQMFVYKPDRLASPPPVLVAIHYCTGTAQAYYSGTQYHSLADQYGFIVIYPDAPDPGGCWDVHTTATLTHNSGGDSLGIVSMVRYAISTWGANANRVFVTGTSSGAMMTNVLIGAYPDVFKGGAAFSGVPYGCFAGSGLWNSQCAQGQLIKTAQQWGDQVRSGYSGFSGARPKMQVWHGTADTTLYVQNFYEEVKQWTNVFGYSQTATSTQNNTPLNGYTKSVYGPNFQAILAQGVGHTVPERAGDVLAFFGLDGTVTTSAGPTSTNSPTTTNGPTSTTDGPTTTTNSSPQTSPTGATAAHWGQCGGSGWTGPTVCESPYTCVKSNDWYSQCL